MFGLLGTIVNVGTVILGSSIGMLFNKKIPKRLTDSLFKVLGLATVFIGVSGCLCGHSTILIIISLILGTLVGELVDLDKRINSFGNFLESKFDKNNQNSRMSEGFVTASILFCIGSMTIVGCLNAGLKGDCTVLFAKSALDLCSSMIFASTMGLGVMFAAGFVLVYQGLLTVLAVFISPYLSAVVIDEMSCVGYIIIIGLGITMISDVKLKLTNMVPAMFFPIALVPLGDLLVRAMPFLAG